MKKILCLLLFSCVFVGCPAEKCALDINNYSGDEIIAVYISPSSSTTWGPNQLEWTIPSGYTYTITGIRPGYYDLHADGRYGGSWTAYEVYLDAPDHTWNLWDKKKSEIKVKSGLGDNQSAGNSSVKEEAGGISK